MTETTRLLLPFSHGIEMDAIEAAVLLAASHHATLVPLSLVHSPQTRGKGARLEHIQQSKDFLEAVRQKALRHGVPIERFEVFTGDVLQSVSVLVHQLKCDGVVLALCGRNGSLLHVEMIEQLIALRPCTLYLMYLSSRQPSWVSRLRERFSRWQPAYQQRAGEYIQFQPILEEPRTQVVRLTQHAGSPEPEKRS